MTCRHQTLTDAPWRLCRCGGKVAECRAPERQHPNTPPLDPAGFHSVRVLDERGEVNTEYTRVNSLYCTRRTCRTYEEEGTE